MRKNISLAGRLISSQDPLLIGGGQGEDPANFRQLTNMRYGDLNPKGVGGHTKINPTALTATGFVKTRSGFHFKKDFPAESHVVIQAENTGETSSAILQNTEDIPSATGNFSLFYSSVGHTTDAIHTDDSSGGLGRFSDAPQGFLAYCNGAESMVWGGSEARVASFIRFDPNDNVKKWDYTEQISNNLTTDEATLAKSGSALDSETFLLHLDDNVTDSGNMTSSPHTVTNNNVTFSSSVFKFGTHSAAFNGTTAYLTVADDADFDLSGGTWTIDMWVDLSTTGADTDNTLFYQHTDDDNYMRLWLDYGADESRRTVKFDIYAAASPVVQLTSVTDAMDDVWNHIAIVQSGGNQYYLFINGSLVDSATDTDDPANYTGLVHFCWDNNSGIGTYFKGRIDEIRVVNGTAVWTSAFTPPTEAYPVNSAEVYLGSILPIQGIKLYVETANTTASTAAVSYWDGSTWIIVSNIADTTEDPAGDTLGQTGTISFDDTSAIAKPRSIDNQFLYWYRLNFPDIDDTTTIYYVTVDVPFQSMKDIWDGDLRTTLTALEWEDSSQSYKDHTTGVFEDRYESTDESSFAKLGASWVAADDYLVFGFTERQAGLSFNMVAGEENNVTASMSVFYWDGDEWLTVGSINDNTSITGNISLGKSGFVTWNPPDVGSEFKRQDLTSRRVAPEKKSRVTGSNIEENDPGTTFEYWGSKADKRLAESVKKQPYALAQLGYPLYFYKVVFSGAIEHTDGVEIYYVGGVSAQNDLQDYGFPSLHQNRLFLSDNTSQHRNEEICAAVGTVNVFNGADSSVFKYGGEEPLTAATTMYSNFKDQLYSLRAVFKTNETWVLFGSSNESWRTIQISNSKGCIAPLTLQRVDIASEAGTVQVCIFQGSNGIHMFDGKNVIDIDKDIEDVFRDGTINSSETANSVSFYDSAKQEYHWLWSSGSNTDHDKEYIFDVRRFKWYEIDRGTGARLQCGYGVEDTDGNTYSYGMIDTGYAMRLENGTTFQTATGAVEIAHTMWLGDFVPSLGAETKLENVNLVGKAVTETDTVTMTHYGDGKAAASAPASTAETQVASGKRIYDARISTQKGGHYTHSLKFEVTTGSEAIGFEPLALSLSYKEEREKGSR